MSDDKKEKPSETSSQVVWQHPPPSPSQMPEFGLVPLRAVSQIVKVKRAEDLQRGDLPFGQLFELIWRDPYLPQSFAECFKTDRLPKPSLERTLAIGISTPIIILLSLLFYDVSAAPTAHHPIKAILFAAVGFVSLFLLDRYYAEDRAHDKHAAWRARWIERCSSVGLSAFEDALLVEWLAKFEVLVTSLLINKSEARTFILMGQTSHRSHNIITVNALTWYVESFPDLREIHFIDDSELVARAVATGDYFLLPGLAQTLSDPSQITNDQEAIEALTTAIQIFAQELLEKSVKSRQQLLEWRRLINLDQLDDARTLEQSIAKTVTELYHTVPDIVHPSWHLAQSSTTSIRKKIVEHHLETLFLLLDRSPKKP